MWLFRLLFSEAEDVAVQAAIQWGQKSSLFSLLFSGTELGFSGSLVLLKRRLFSLLLSGA
jgi:hypothetical protein